MKAKKRMTFFIIKLEIGPTVCIHNEEEEKPNYSPSSDPSIEGKKTSGSSWYAEK